MKKGIQLLILFSILIAFTNCQKKNTDRLYYKKKYVDEIKQTRKSLSLFIQQNSIPGLNIAISKNGELIYSEGIGWASRELSVKTTRNTKFRIGNTSELFTAAIYHKMAEEGKLSPDSSVNSYLKNYPGKGKDIPLKYLTNHVSGIRKMSYKESSEPGRNSSLQKGLDKFKNDSLQFSPGRYFYESSFNYNLLGAIMEKVSGKHFNKLLEKYITDTLLLKNTEADFFLSTIKNRSNYFDANMFSQPVNAISTDMRWRWPSDGLLSNAEDLVKLGNVYLNSDYFNEQTRKNLFKPFKLKSQRPSNMSDGWFIIEDRNKNKIYGRQGSVIGGSSAILIYPEQKLIVAIATNITKGTDNSPIFKIANYFLPENDTTQVQGRD